MSVLLQSFRVSSVHQCRQFLLSFLTTNAVKERPSVGRISIAQMKILVFCINGSSDLLHWDINFHCFSLKTVKSFVVSYKGSCSVVTSRKTFSIDEPHIQRGLLRNRCYSEERLLIGRKCRNSLGSFPFLLCISIDKHLHVQSNVSYLPFIFPLA